MRTSTRIQVLAILAAKFIAPAFGQQPVACHVDPFQGATLPQGAIAQMTVVNTGASCAITNFGASGRTNPADAGSIKAAPAHGSAEFVAPQAKYTPEPGFVGEDEFSYDAFAKGNMNQQLRLRVTVKVKVVAQ